jgi:diguanylate cyclase (GGDEF)-like protein
MGDLLIQQVSTRITDVVREVDVVSTVSFLEYSTEHVARFGGDEFTVLLSEINNSEEAGLVAKRIISSIEKSFLLTTHEVYITPSIGVAVFPDDGTDIHQLLKHADTAMYHAKESGKNNYQFYSSKMSAHVEEHLKIEALLRKALIKNELTLFYQPQISGFTGKLVGAEALLRWENEEAGNISPDVFIPVAERTGMILDIGEWVIREACRQNKEWQEKRLMPIKVAVNLSGVQFIQKDLCQKVQNILDEVGLLSKHLELEITESTIMQNIDETIHTLNTLKLMGLDIAIDDFGTGYSSLSYLKKFPIKALKIDRSFVMDIPHNEDDVKLTTAIISLAKSLNLKVVAEGVENHAQQQFLAELECDYLQGYLFSKPLSADDFEKLLMESRNDGAS